jgi:hypothetical protein
MIVTFTAQVSGEPGPGQRFSREAGAALPLGHRFGLDYRSARRSLAPTSVGTATLPVLAI